MENQFYTPGQQAKFDSLLEQNGVTPDRFQPALSTPIMATLAEAMVTVDLTKVDISLLRQAYGMPPALNKTAADFPLWKWIEYFDREPQSDGGAIITRSVPRDVELVRIPPEEVGLDYDSTPEAVIRLARRAGLKFFSQRAIEPLLRALIRDGLPTPAYLICVTKLEKVGISVGREPGTKKMLAVIGSDTGHHNDWSVIMARPS